MSTIKKGENNYGKIIKKHFEGGGRNPLIARVLGILHARHSEGAIATEESQDIKEIFRLTPQDDYSAKHDKDCSLFTPQKMFILAEVSEKFPRPFGERARERGLKCAFTLAEVLITLGVIGVVAAITMPVLMTNVQARVQKEQVRSAKYKLTLATDKMKSLGLLGETYPTTESFINELKKHYKLAKICDNSHLTDCWPTDKIEVPTENGGTDTINIDDLKKGSDLKSLGLGTKDTQTMGIITADGVPMILTYSPKCSPLDQARTYSWSTVDNKPETNATTNCISAIMDINGKGKPNRLGKDVRTWNSLLGYIRYSATKITYDECMSVKDKLGIQSCYTNTNGTPRDDDYWAGAMNQCYKIGLHLPSMQTLATIAGARFGRSDIGPYTLIMSNAYAQSQKKSDNTYYTDCKEWYNANNGDYDRVGHSDNVICTDGDIPTDDSAGIAISDGGFWPASEVSPQRALVRGINGSGSGWNQGYRNYEGVPLCVGD